MTKQALVAFVGAVLSATVLFAFTPPTDTQQGVTLAIASKPDIVA